MEHNIELEISFYCYCSICKDQYHDFSNSSEPNTATLELVDTKMGEENL